VRKKGKASLGRNKEANDGDGPRRHVAKESDAGDEEIDKRGKKHIKGGRKKVHQKLNRRQAPSFTAR